MAKENQYHKNQISVSLFGEAAITICSAIILSLIPVYRFEYGGVVTLCSMLPILIFSLRNGVINGMIVGAIYGIFKITLGAYYFVPLQGVLEYPLAFSLLGAAGYLKGQMAGPKIKMFLILMLAMGLRYLCSFVSGLIFFKEYAGFQPLLLFSFRYNLHIFVEILLCFSILFLFVKKTIRIWG